MSHIAQDITKPPATVYSYLLYHGGIEPKTRVRRLSFLSFEERESISRGIASGLSMHGIARELGRHSSTISREISRNGGLKRYRGSIEEKNLPHEWQTAKATSIGENGPLREGVASLLELDWPSEQIAGRLKKSSGDGKQMCVSHETIHRSLFIQTRGLFKEELKKHLRTKRMFRHAKSQQNAYVERFNSTVRCDWLSQHYWQSIDEVQEFATQWMHK